MTDPKDRFRRVANGMGRSALDAGAEGLKGEIGEAFPQIAKFFGQKNPGPVQRKYTQNPFNAEEDDAEEENPDYPEHGSTPPSGWRPSSEDEDEDEDDDDYNEEGTYVGGGYAQVPEDDEDDDEEDDSTSLAFEYVNAADDNMLLAVAAWRAYAKSGEFIAQHPHTGITFFGNEADFNDFCNHKDMNATNWTKYTDAATIMAMDHDPETLEALVSGDEQDEEFLEKAKAQFEGFHWGDKSRTVGFLAIPGLSGDVPLTFLGVGRELCYGAQKEGEFVEYYHLMGEESKTYPMVYALGEDTIVIHGGGMKIEDRGIID
jgi:hypothetical protein